MIHIIIFYRYHFIYIQNWQNKLTIIENYTHDLEEGVEKNTK